MRANVRQVLCVLPQSVPGVLVCIVSLVCILLQVQTHKVRVATRCGPKGCVLGPSGKCGGGMCSVCCANEYYATRTVCKYARYAKKTPEQHIYYQKHLDDRSV